MSRSYRKYAYKPAGNRRRSLKKDLHRISRTRLKRDFDLTDRTYGKYDSDLSWELNEGRRAPAYTDYVQKRRAHDPKISNKRLRKEYYKQYRMK